MNTFRIIIFAVALSLACLGSLSAQVLDISSGGAPTITGSVGGSVTGSPDVQNDLVVTVNFGELSAMNTNSIVKVTVPIALRSRIPYQVTVTYAGSSNANPQAIQKSDIGFGISNWHALANGRICNGSPHIIYAPFGNDPSTTRTIAANGRAQYTSTLGNITTATLILSGPRLSQNASVNRQPNDGYVFDAIFVVTPQFFAAGTTSATLTFTISAGPAAPC